MADKIQICNNFQCIKIILLDFVHITVLKQNAKHANSSMHTSLASWSSLIGLHTPALQSINQSINQSTNESTNQSIKQLCYFWCGLSNN